MRHPPLRQYLYFCASKASKLSTWSSEAVMAASSTAVTPPMLLIQKRMHAEASARRAGHPSFA